jgi:hypothetical protein
MSEITSGLYEATDTALGREVRLRIQREGGGPLRRVSGDVVFANGQIISFLGDSDLVERDLRISCKVTFYSSRQLSRTGSQVEIIPAGGAGLPAVDVTMNIGSGTATARLARTGDALRRLTLAMDGLKDLPIPDASVFEDHPDGKDLIAVLARASIAVSYERPLSYRPDPSDRKVHNSAELHDLLVKWGKPPTEAFDPWWLHVLFAGQYDGRDGKDVSGVMYDVGLDEDASPRQGLAVFLNSAGIIAQGPPNSDAWKREVLFTLIHEIGHGLNLPHCFESGRPEALSWMNYPDRVSGNLDAFWSRFAHTFDVPELDFLCHAPHIDIAPGQCAYARRVSTLIEGGSADATLLRTPATSEGDDATSAVVSLSALKPIYGYGEPVFLRLALHNTGKKPIRYAKALDPSDGLVTIEVTGPSGRTRTLRPPMILCQRHRLKRLGPGKSVSFDGIFAGFDAEGPLFAEPGRYRLQASFAGVPGGVIASAPVHLRVLYPTRQEELLAIRIWDDGPLMRAIYHRQPLIALDSWRDLVDVTSRVLPSDPENTVGAFLQYIAALGWMQWFAPASRRRGFAPDLDKAQERMSKARHTFLPSGVERKRRILARGRLRNA